MNAVATGPKSHRFRSRESIPELAVRRYRVGRNPAQEARPRHAKYPFFFLFATCSSPIALSSPPPSFFPLPLSVPVSHTPPPPITSSSSSPPHPLVQTSFLLHLLHHHPLCQTTRVFYYRLFIYSPHLLKPCLFVQPQTTSSHQTLKNFDDDGLRK